jgi:hypothetical protein
VGSSSRHYFYFYLDKSKNTEDGIVSKIRRAITENERFPLQMLEFYPGLTITLDASERNKLAFENASLGNYNSIFSFGTFSAAWILPQFFSTARENNLNSPENYIEVRSKINGYSWDHEFPIPLNLDSLVMEISFTNGGGILDPDKHALGKHRSLIKALLDVFKPFYCFMIDEEDGQEIISGYSQLVIPSWPLEKPWDFYWDLFIFDIDYFPNFRNYFSNPNENTELIDGQYIWFESDETWYDRGRSNTDEVIGRLREKIADDLEITLLFGSSRLP